MAANTNNTLDWPVYPGHLSKKTEQSWPNGQLLSRQVPLYTLGDTKSDDENDTSGVHVRKRGNCWARNHNTRPTSKTDSDNDERW